MIYKIIAIFSIILLIGIAVYFNQFYEPEPIKAQPQPIIGNNNCMLNKESRFDQDVCMSNMIVKMNNTINSLQTELEQLKKEYRNHEDFVYRQCAEIPRYQNSHEIECRALGVYS